MRWILWSLLLANLAYAGWQVLREPPSPAREQSRQLANAPDEIILLKELSADAVVELESLVNKPAVTVQAPQSTVQGCLALGPFPSIFESQNADRKLRALGYALEVRPVDQATGKFDYRLLIPPLPSLEEAFRKLRELQASKIDSYVFTSGPNAMGISLGIFSSEEGAQRARKRIAAAGFEGRVITNERTERSYWLFANQGIPLDLDPSIIADLELPEASLTVKEFSCE